MTKIPVALIKRNIDRLKRVLESLPKEEVDVLALCFISMSVGSSQYLPMKIQTEGEKLMDKVEKETLTLFKQEEK